MPLMSYCFPNDTSWTFGHLHCQNLLLLPIFGRMRYGSTELITIVAVPCFRKWLSDSHRGSGAERFLNCIAVTHAKKKKLP